MRVPTVLVVGATDRVAAACRRALTAFTIGAVVRAEVADAATQAAKHRPFALVLPEDVYRFDPQEFDALARDVGASVVAVFAVDAPAEQLAEDLGEALRAAFAQRRP